MPQSRGNKTNIDWEYIIASMPGCVYWKDLKGVYLGCNDATAELLGIPKEKIIGYNDYQIAQELGWSLEVVQAICEVDKKVMQTGLPILDIEEMPFHDKKGNIIQQITNKAPLYDEKRNIKGIIGNSINITRRKKIEEELRQAKIAEESANQEHLLYLSNLHKEVVGQAIDPPECRRAC